MMFKKYILIIILALLSFSSFSQTPYVTGICYIDLNSNGIMDPGEPPLQNIFVQPENCHDPLVTCINGNYFAYLCSADDTLTVLQPEWATYFTVNPSWHYVWQDSAYVNFGFVLDPSALDLQVTGITADPLPVSGRPGAIHISYRNIANRINDPVITFTLDNSVVFDSASPSPDIIQGDSLIWNLDTLQTLEHGMIHVYYETPPTLNTGNILHFSASITPISGDFNPNDNIFTIDAEVKNSETEILKSVSDSIIEISEIQNSPKLTYTIRFRNTSSTEIANVRITDTLSVLLKRYTFDFTTSSHQCTYQIEPNGNVSFYFSNIFLPDSATDYSGSFAHFSYTLRTRSDINIHDSIKNIANIFYDFNEAVNTNTVLTLIDNPTLSPSIAESNLYLFPNPAIEEIFITPSINCYYNIYNTNGKCSLTGHTDSGMINISQLLPGIYFLSINENTGRGIIFIKD